MKKRIAIIGSTGSIGKQALEVIKQHPDQFEVEILTAYNNFELLIKQAVEFTPNTVVIANDEHYKTVFNHLDPLDIKVYSGEDAIGQVLGMDTIDMVLIAVVGFAGLKPTLAALENKKRIALANKESLVIAGQLIQQKAIKNNIQIIPVDSEHSAIFQCLMGEGNNPVEKIVLTASGGPFRGMRAASLKNISPELALNHPVWQMGQKVTIDSATLMNKGLEAIEAHWLFGVPASNIEVVIHPESVIHSMVYFTDGSVKTQMSSADMRIPIQFALTYPDRFANSAERLDLVELGALHFEAPDVKIFRNLALAFEALEKGGNLPCILNAANEIAVQAFLKHQVGFLQISNVVEHCMDHVAFIKDPTLNDYFETDKITRFKAIEFIN